MQSGERYGMPPTDMQVFTTAPAGTAVGARGAGSSSSTRGLAHLFGHPETATPSSDMSGLHNSLREQQPHSFHLHSHRPHLISHHDQQYIPSHQLDLHHHLSVRGNPPHLMTTAPFLHAALSSGHGGLHHQMPSFFKSTGMSGQQQQPSDTSTIPHSFLMTPAGHSASQDQFKLPNFNQLQHEEADASPSHWRADETAALVQICSDIHDSSIKAPGLGEDIARKLQEMGYQRSPKKCKDKFESIQHNYKKRKDENQSIQRRELEFSSDFSSEGGHAEHVQEGGHAPNIPNNRNYANDEDGEEVLRHDDDDKEKSKKRKTENPSCWTPSKSFFETLTREIMEKQEEMHRAFLDTIERKDRERSLREDAYRRQEAARLDREQEIRAQEVSIAAARDAALIAFLEKATGTSLSTAPSLPKMTNLVPSLSSNPSSGSPHAGSLAAALLQHQPSDHLLHQQALQDAADMQDNNCDFNTKRWPKVEVHALIRLRSGMEPRFREAGPKAHLWQEISASMACLGFIRSPKRCKEKWENINKYFKKTKDSSKKRPENAKTCPYFHQLDTLYQRGILASSSSSPVGNKLLGKPDSQLLEFSTQENEGGSFNLQNAESGDTREGNGSESGELAMKVQHAEHQGARDNDMNTNQVNMLGASQNSIFVSDLYHDSQNSGSGASSTMVANLPQHSASGAPSMIPLSQHMDKFLHHHHHHTHHEGLDMAGVSSKKSMQVEMFVKDILNLQQQQHQKLIDEYDRMEHAHELGEMERHQMKAAVGTAAAGASTHSLTNSHDNATLMALVHKLAGDSSDLTMSAPSSME